MGGMSLRIGFNTTAHRAGEKMTWQKLKYIHRNPVVDKIVYNEQDYLFSSAPNYYGIPNVLEIDCLTPPFINVRLIISLILNCSSTNISGY